jgi:hypothetical protein
MDKDKQMEFLFEEGGIADDGMNRDPISGNEVPPGSLAEEVRDDIPAALSEGEYVVPADVVRYYGVKFFEDLRGEAKQGLGQMEEDGRIGGEPINMEEELSPEERAEIASMMGMAVGGMVSQQPMQPDDPYMQQANLYRAPAAMGNTMQQRGFQEGGLTTSQDGTQVQLDPMQFQAGFTFARPVQRPQTTTVTLYGPNGEVRPVLFPSGEYDRLIAEGFTTQQGAGVAKVTTEASPEVTGEGGGGGGSDFTTFSGGQPRNLSELSVEELQSNLRGLDTMGRIGGALAVAVNPVFGLAARAALAANRNNLVQELVNRGVDISDYREERGRDLYGGGISMYDGLQDTSGDGRVSFGDTWLGDALGFDGKAGVQGPGLKESREGARRDFSTTTPTRTTSTPSAPASTTSSSDRDSGDDRPTSWSGGSVAENQSAPSSSRSSADSRASAQRAADRQGTSLATGGRAEGGFVSRRNKNKK